MKTNFHSILHVAAAAVIMAAVSPCHAADSFSSGLSPSADARMAVALAKWIDSGELPGAISILCNGDRTEVTCVGFADVAAKRPITLDNAFMQCSQTKGFCGVTAAILVEEGKLSLDDPVSKYLPEFKTWSTCPAHGGLGNKTAKTSSLRYITATDGTYVSTNFTQTVYGNAEAPFLPGSPGGFQWYTTRHCSRR